MRIISKRVLKEFWEEYPDSEQQLKSWHAEAKSAKWKNPNELKEQYEKTSIIGDGRVVFNICGNK
ncbi:MAG: type II toxin-antitoxin system HigB family toxin, partial [Bacteroidota bacterium]